MLIAFQGGDIQAEICNSALYFKVRDLLTIVKAINGTCNNYYNIVAKHTNIEYWNFSNYTYRAPRYIHQKDVLSFLDNIHEKTRDDTIMFMHEFVITFRNELEIE